MGGTYDPDNVVELTVEDHAIAHKVLYGLYGRWQDKIAWLTLSGQIGGEEARLEAYRKGYSNRDMSFAKTEEFRRKVSLSGRGKKHVIRKKIVRTQEANAKRSASAMGNNWGVGNRGNPGPQPTVTCPHCSKIGGRAIMRRYHFDMCKDKKNVS